MPGIWSFLPLSLIALDACVRLALIVRVVAKRSPVPDTLAWVLLLLLLPVGSWIFYLLVGEHRLGSRRARRAAAIAHTVESRTISLWKHRPQELDTPHGAYQGLSQLATNLSGLPTLRGNTLELIGDAGAFLEKLVADIDAAKHHCHLLYYIWEPDSKGAMVGDALVRAAQRGVVCRVVVDSVGSDNLLGSEVWRRMERAGVKLVEALPASALRALFSRVDLRNHRKIAVIDGLVAYCGSQNITEENFRPRMRGAGRGAGPWIDATVRVRGPAVHALQTVFLCDWTLDGEHQVPSMDGLMPDVPVDGPSVVHVIPSGPGPRPDAIHQAVLAMLYAAREEIIMTTPYFVPDEATKAAMQNASLRGVQVTLILPERTDSVLVSAAGRSHLQELLDAGVHVYVHSQGMLHAKVAVVDRAFGVIGSANFDMRSFWLNYEATLFVYDEDFAGTLRFLQQGYLTHARELTAEGWRRRPFGRVFLDNCAQLLGPLL